MQDSNLRMHESKSCALPTWLIPIIKLVSAQGFEPRTHALEGRCSIQLSYAPTFLKVERVKGIEPSQPAWKAGTLPLSYTRAFKSVGGGWWIRTTESDANRFTVCPLWPLGKSSVFGAGNRTRTYNLLITSQLLYQLSHTSILILKLVATWKGLEPSTSSVTGWHSNQLNYQAAFLFKWWDQQGSNL